MLDYVGSQADAGTLDVEGEPKERDSLRNENDREMFNTHSRRTTLSSRDPPLSLQFKDRDRLRKQLARGGSEMLTIIVDELMDQLAYELRGWYKRFSG